MTPIFFKREVLKKYYESPDKYSIEDGSVSHRGFWHLRVMNNHRDHVVAWLGDLKGMPYKEQTHWRTFNLTPGTRKISYTDFSRNIEGEFTDPKLPEFYFKYKLSQFQIEWGKKFGWDLFKSLSEDDSHHLKSLHVPTTEEQKEFDDQILSLTKILINSLNEEGLTKAIQTKTAESGSINKLDSFLASKNKPFPRMIEYMRNLQSLRSTSVAHRKSIVNERYQKALKYFEMDKSSLIDVFENILIKACYVLNTLENHFLK